MHIRKKIILMGLIILIPTNIFVFNKQQVKNLLRKKGKQINAARCDFRGIGPDSKLQGFDFSNANISGALFNSNDSSISSSENVVGTIMIPGQVTDLSGSSFVKAQCISTGFHGVNLQNTRWSGANIASADFSNANLKGAKDLDKTQNIQTASFCGAIMPDGTTLSGDNWKSKSGVIFNSYCSISKKLDAANSKSSIPAPSAYKKVARKKQEVKKSLGN